jgi:hypothetical protein
MVFKKNDPDGYRILRNINLATKRNNKIMESQWFEDRYLYLSNNSRIFPDDYIHQKETIYFDDLLNILYKNLSFQNDMPKLIHTVLTQIEHDNRYAWVLHKNQFYQALRHILTFHTRTDDTSNLPADTDPALLNVKRAQIINYLIVLIKPVIKETYFDICLGRVIAK